jgi:hypothetical protein
VGRVTALSPERGLFDPVLVAREQSTKDGASAPAPQAKIDDRSGNVDENKGSLTSAAGQREVPVPSEQHLRDARVGITAA